MPTANTELRNNGANQRLFFSLQLMGPRNVQMEKMTAQQRPRLCPSTSLPPRSRCPYLGINITKCRPETLEERSNRSQSVGSNDAPGGAFFCLLRCIHERIGSGLPVIDLDDGGGLQVAISDRLFCCCDAYTTSAVSCPKGGGYA